MAVTITVISYNSSLTIIDTLESILYQTYPLEWIELIISDDFSSDNTLDIVNYWVISNRFRFKNVIVITSETNGGVTANCNQAWKIASSDWIKTIAGDDILCPNCIEKNVNFITENENIFVLFSKMQSFYFGEQNIRNIGGVYPLESEQHFFRLDTVGQLKFLMSQSISGAPTVFIKKSILAVVGYADERFAMIEDYPLWFKLAQNNIRIYFMDEITILYRISDSLSRTSSRIVNLTYFLDLYNFEKTCIFPLLNNRKVLRYRKKIWYSLNLKIISLFDNKRNKYSTLISNLVFLLFKPGGFKLIINKIFKAS